MTRLAFLFPGQGAQRPGMGAALAASDPELLAARLAGAGAASGLPIEQLCADGPATALMRTEVAQPALFAVSLALADVAHAAGLRPHAVAGHSLGEYTAAVAAGALAVADGEALVARRGRLMAGAQRERPGAMAAVVGLDAETVGALCADAAGGAALAPANFNAPAQTVVSGDAEAVERLLALVAARGLGRAVRLPVGAAFHSPLMRAVADELDGVTAGLAWRAPDVPIAANASGGLVATAEGVRRALVTQVAAPVRWVSCVHALVDAGCRHFLELGPGRVLSGLVRQICPGADVAAADSRAAIEAFAATRPHLLSA